MRGNIRIPKRDAAAEDSFFVNELTTISRFLLYSFFGYINEAVLHMPRLFHLVPCIIFVMDHLG